MPNMKMIRTTISTLAMTYFLLACGQTPNPTTKPTDSQATTQKILGTAELMVGDGIRSSDLPTISPKGAINESGVQFSRLVSSGATDSATERYVWATYEFKNITTGNLTNLSLYAYNESANNAAGTAFKAVRRLDNTPITDVNVIRGIQPSAGLILNAGVFNINPAAADSQVFRSSEASAVDAGAKTLGSLLPNDSILEYGFTVRSASGDRTLIPNELGVVTLGFRVPLQTIVTDTPRRFTTMFTYATDAITRVTRDKSETTAQVVARAAAPVSATEAVLIGTDTDLATPLTTIRLPAFKTFVPSEALIGSEGGIIQLDRASLIIPAGAVTTATKFKLERLPAVPAALTDPDPLTTVSTYRLDSNVASFAKPLALVVPVDVPTTSLGSDVNTNLYEWNGTTYEQIRIGANNTEFNVYVETLPTAAIGNGYTTAMSYVAARGLISQLKTACETRGGAYNGKFCHEVSPAIATARLLPIPYKVMSFQAGNGIEAGNNKPFYCGFENRISPGSGQYIFKLCNYADEKRAAKTIRDRKPDIVAIQELWNDKCESVDPDSARVCGKFNAIYNPKQIERVIDTRYYDYQCAVPFIGSDSKYHNGHECIAVRKTVFQFVPSIFATTPGYVANIINSCNDRTGLQVATVKPVLPVAPSNVTVNNTQFDVVNAHLDSPPFFSCRLAQLQALRTQYLNIRERSIILGDFNTDPASLSELPALRDEWNRSVANRTTPIDKLVSTQLWYQLDDTSQRTEATFGSLDHVISNFLTGTCQRGAKLQSFDHLFTTCSLTGFNFGTVTAAVFGFDLFGVLGNYPLLTIPRVSRQGVKLDYVPFKRQGLSGNLVYLPDGLETSIYFDPLCPAPIGQLTKPASVGANEVTALGAITVAIDGQACPPAI
jgi:Endonuclease/Exonuclease/phosphatase family